MAKHSAPGAQPELMLPGSSSEYLVAWLSRFRNLLSLIYMALLIYAALGEPVLRLEYRYRGDRSNMLSCKCITITGKTLHYSHYMPFFFFIKEDGRTFPSPRNL